MQMRPEIELLLYCARMQMGTGSTTTFAKLVQAPGLSWPNVIETALQHGMLPLLAQHLRRTCADAVSPPDMAALRAQFQAHARHNLLQTNTLLTLLDDFRQHGIAAMPYKGPALAAAIYGNIVLRPFCDLDVVVHKRDVQQAKSLLIAQGFQPCESMTEAEEKVYLEQHHAYTFVREADHISVDLHWDITQKYFAVALDSDALWSRLQTIDLCGVAVESLPIDDLLLVLCIHGAKHHWCRLGWICDVALLLNAYPDIDWPAILQTARQIKSERMLLLGLRLAVDLMAAPLPADLLSMVRANTAVKNLATQMTRRVCGADETPFNLIERELLYPRMRECWRDRMPYVGHLLGQLVRLRPQDKAWLPVPAYLSGLYYPLRLLRLGVTYGLRPLRAKLRSAEVKS